MGSWPGARGPGIVARGSSPGPNPPPRRPRGPARTGGLITMSDTALDLARIEAERQRIREKYLRPSAERPETTARGVHHTALLSSDVERTVRFYQGILGVPLTDIFENRDYRGSNHFFFDIGNGNLLAFFDFPDLGLRPYAEVLGGLHHLSLSVEPETWERLKAKLDVEGIVYLLECVYSC